MERFDEIDKIKKQLKQLKKKEEEVLQRIWGEVNKYPFIVERNGKQYVNAEAKRLYCGRRDAELIPIQQQILALEKKNNDIIETLIQDGLIEEYGVEFIGASKIKPIPTVYINGKEKYVRIMIRLHKITQMKYVKES